MKLKNSLSLVLLALIGAGVAACGAGGEPQKMPTGPWQMTFTNGLVGGSSGYNDCSESGTYTVYVTPATYATDGFTTNVSQQPPYNEVFYGTFDSQIGGGSNGDSCFAGLMGNESQTSAIQFCSPQIQQGTATIKFTGCSLSQINYVYYFNATYQIWGTAGYYITGLVSGYNGSAPQ